MLFLHTLLINFLKHASTKKQTFFYTILMYKLQKERRKHHQNHNFLDNFVFDFLLLFPERLYMRMRFHSQNWISQNKSGFKNNHFSNIKK